MNVEQILKGQPLSSGIGMGNVALVEPSLDIKLSKIFPIQDPAEEKCRYHTALDSTLKELYTLRDDFKGQGLHEAEQIVEAHVEILLDPLLQEEMEEEIKRGIPSAEALQGIIEKYVHQFADNAYFQEKLLDIKGVLGRVIEKLTKQPRPGLNHYPSGAILVAKEISPADLAGVQPGQIGALVMDACGPTSHVAIFARAKGIPFLSNLPINFSDSSLHGLPAVVDAEAGFFVLNPQPATKEKYKLLLKKLLAQSQKKEKPKNGSINLMANIGDIGEIETIDPSLIAGVGLFRSEYLCLNGKGWPSEEAQFKVYSKLAQSIKGPVVVRVFDLQGDKIPSWLPKESEENPALGCRGLRFLLKHEEMFRVQVRALYRASAFGQIKILLPMVAEVEELRQCLALFAKWRQELIEEKCHLAKHVPIGVMIEIPSAVYAMEDLVLECDFFSIGTNDLLQYFFAKDRGSSSLTLLHHPSFLRLLKQLVEKAGKLNASVSLCGEMASFPQLVPLLLGLGITTLSVTPSLSLKIREAIDKVSLSEAEQLANACLLAKTAEEVQALLQIVS